MQGCSLGILYYYDYYELVLNDFIRIANCCAFIFVSDCCSWRARGKLNRTHLQAIARPNAFIWMAIGIVAVRRQFYIYIFELSRKALTDPWVLLVYTNSVLALSVLASEPMRLKSILTCFSRSLSILRLNSRQSLREPAGSNELVLSTRRTYDHDSPPGSSRSQVMSSLAPFLSVNNA